jgi:hypothetical protein
LPPFPVHGPLARRALHRQRLYARLAFRERFGQLLAKALPKFQHLIFDLRQGRCIRLLIPGQCCLDQLGGLSFQFGFQFGARPGHGIPPG